MSLEGKLGLVTGGASGLGEATVRRLARDGAGVVIADRDKGRGEALAKELNEAGRKVAFCHMDISKADDVDRMVSFTVDTLGGLNFAVNNAGFGHPLAKLHEISVETFDEQIAVNLRGPFLCTRAEVTYMLGHGGGSIVNISTVAALRAVRGTSVHVAAKSGILGLSRTAALDYAPDNIRINVVAPGGFFTPLMDKTGTRKHWESMQPSGRLGEPEELANAVAFLVSDESSYISAVTLPVAFAVDQGSKA
jgi:NAD(P)-dependent dehydrogenase (short-subunit alcohol dehydrogenase family)